MSKTSFLDGCHRLGWVINLVAMLLMFAYYNGETHATLEAVKTNISDLTSRVSRLESHFIERGVR